MRQVGRCLKQSCSRGGSNRDLCGWILVLDLTQAHPSSSRCDRISKGIVVRGQVERVESRRGFDAGKPIEAGEIGAAHDERVRSARRIAVGLLITHAANQKCEGCRRVRHKSAMRGNVLGQNSSLRRVANGDIPASGIGDPRLHGIEFDVSRRHLFLEGGGDIVRKASMQHVCEQGVRTVATSAFVARGTYASLPRCASPAKKRRRHRGIVNPDIGVCSEVTIPNAQAAQSAFRCVKG